MNAMTVTAMTSPAPEAWPAPLPPELAAPPEAPLAMPRQRLEADRPSAVRSLAGLLRPLFARVGRSGG